MEARSDGALRVVVGSPRVAAVRHGALLLGISTALWFGGRFWPWGWVAGLVLLMAAGPSKAEKKGYHDF